MWNNTIIKRAENEDTILEIGLETDAVDPREHADPMTTMVCFHRNYSLGDKHSYRQDDYNSWEEVGKAIKEDNAIVLMQPLYMYEHSGITISTGPYSCPWDSGQIGFIYVTRESMADAGLLHLEESICETDIQRAQDILDAEVDEYDMYVRGEVYYFRVSSKKTCECCNHTKIEVIDSCTGFYGYEHLEESLKEYVGERAIELIDKLEDVN